MTTRSRFAVVGGGWRSQFYLSVVSHLSDRFDVVGVVTDHADQRTWIHDHWGVPVFESVESLLEHCQPDFVVTSIRPDENAKVVTQLVMAGIAVLSETPPAPQVREMEELYELCRERKGIVEVAEQNPNLPIYAAARETIRRGYIGEPRFVAVSATVTYHSVALIRNLLSLGRECAEVRAIESRSRMIEGPGRQGWPPEPQVISAPHLIATLQFPGDKLGLFDWTRGQSFHPILPHRLLVRGENGELTMQGLVYLARARTPVRLRFERHQSGRTANLDGYCLYSIFIGDEEVYSNPFAPARLSDEEIAIATCLDGIAARVDGGTGRYGLEAGCEDNYLGLAIDEAAESGSVVKTIRRGWSE